MGKSTCDSKQCSAAKMPLPIERDAQFNTDTTVAWHVSEPLDEMRRREWGRTQPQLHWKRQDKTKADPTKKETKNDGRKE